MTTLRRVSSYTRSTTQRPVPLTRLASWLLAGAFAISTAYQIYRSTLMEVPAHDRFDLSTAAMYGLCIGLSLLVGTGRRWTTWLGLSMSVWLTLVGIFYYFPVTTPVRTFGLIDWAEGVLFIGQIVAAGVLCICELCGVALTVGPKAQRSEPTPTDRYMER